MKAGQLRTSSPGLASSEHRLFYASTSVAPIAKNSGCEANWHAAIAAIVNKSKRRSSFVAGMIDDAADAEKSKNA
jgi:hypothetical protein